MRPSWARSPGGIGPVIAIVLLASIVAPSSCAQTVPPYARVGAFATYDAIGGYVAYFGGVSGNATYTVNQVFGNGSMRFEVFENLTGGSDINSTVVSYNFTDSFSRPSKFPAFPPSDWGSGQVTIFGVKATLQRHTDVNVPAGTFATAQFIGKDSNGTQVFYWLDNATGLVVEMASGGGAYELRATNIALPIATPSEFEAALPYTIALLLSLSLGTVLFLVYHWRRQKANARMTASAAKK